MDEKEREAYEASMNAAQGGAAWGSPAPGAYGAPANGAPADASYGGQPPVPPVPPVQAPGVYGYEPPQQSQQKRRWPWFLLGLAVGLLVGMGGCVSCAGIMAAATFDRGATSSAFNYAQPAVPEDSFGIPSPDEDFDFSYGYGDDGYGNDNSNGSGQMPNGGSGSGIQDQTYSLDDIKGTMFPNGVPENAPSKDGACLEGIYTVGKNGQIPAGLYFLQGAEDAESNFYVFSGTNDPNAYTVDDSVVYFGNYFTQLDEGDLIVFKPSAADLTMIPAPDTAMNVKPPYNDGCYRVGIDIPAGSYAITAYEPSYQVATNDPGAFVMNDLDFDTDSIAESVYVIPGGKQVVTVEDGQYLELFAATATPVAQG